jgi:hypothetical protein
LRSVLPCTSLSSILTINQARTYETTLGSMKRFTNAMIDLLLLVRAAGNSFFSLSAFRVAMYAR